MYVEKFLNFLTIGFYIYVYYFSRSNKHAYLNDYSSYSNTKLHSLIAVSHSSRFYNAVYKPRKLLKNKFLSIIILQSQMAQITKYIHTYMLCISTIIMHEYILTTF